MTLEGDPDLAGDALAEAFLITLDLDDLPDRALGVGFLEDVLPFLTPFFAMTLSLLRNIILQMQGY